LLDDGVDDLLGGNVGAEIVDREPGAFEQHDNQVLADVVQVASHRSIVTSATWLS
jgi:hypothetical protein